ncbi:MAG: hypothetical protein RBT79_12090, partial [Chiayiivirga sp.]|nr:hypothetical protein [Chiayiivirga sp.]
MSEFTPAAGTRTKRLAPGAEVAFASNGCCVGCHPGCAAAGPTPLPNTSSATAALNGAVLNAFIFKLPMSVMRTNDPSIRAKVHRAYHFFCMGKKSGRRASGTGPHPENEGPPAGEALRSIRRTLV